ncbi:MAG: DNA polymerase I [Leptospira sp.]|nr:DNA polymerase I [Leptospira sp.]
MSKKTKKLMIIDGHAMVFRSYFAFSASNLTNSKTGQPSGAVFGFFRMLFKVMQDFDISHIAVTFDPGTRLDRNDLYEDYKATRKPMPEDLRPQITEIQDILKELEFPILKINGKEADDIIGTLCKKYEKKYEEIIILSGDKDLYQVLSPTIHMLRGKKGVSEFQKIDPDWVKEELGITTEQVIDYMAILGDSSDNIPGVKGIGEKGAGKLIQEYGNLETIYKNLDKLSPPSLKSKLEENKENAFLSRKLATIECNLDLDIKPDDLIIPNYLVESKILYLKQQGYNVLSRDLAKQAGIKLPSDDDLDEKSDKNDKSKNSNSDSKTINSEAKKGKYTRIKSSADLKKILSGIKKGSLLAIDTETTSVYPNHAHLLGISFSAKEGEGYYIPVAYSESLYALSLPDADEILKIFKPILEDPKIFKTGQNIKYDWIVLEKYGIQLQGVVFDTMIASYILNPGIRKHNMDDMAMDYLNYKTITYEELVGKGKKKQDLFNIDPDQVAEYAAEDADITLRLHNILEKRISESGMEKVFRELDLPLVPVLKDIEMAGISLDTKYFAKLSKDFEKKIKELEKRIHTHAGKEFNIASTKELQVVLFEELNLPAEKKTQTGYSTDHSVLESLLGMHPIIEDLLSHRKFTKLKSTYVDTLPELVHPETGRIHTSYNQTIAATGRLSSQDPNLQNIPIKDEEGRLLRHGFIPKNDDYEILSLDYSQIELRIMAHFSEDPQMLDAYQKGLDIHRRTAAGLFEVSEDQVNPEMRNKAKIVNFSIIYGATGFGLAQNLRISRTEAKQFIDRYFLQYKGVQTYMDSMVEFCKKNGYVETLMGRKRFIPDINAKNRQAQEGAKRIAINSPIQGTSADMIKIAMIDIHKEILKQKFQSKIIMQVHDELVFEVHKKEKAEFRKIAEQKMVDAIPLKVPIIVDGKFGKNWEEAH